MLGPELRTRVENLVTLLRVRDANADWYVTLVGIWNPECEIFRKDYVYVREREVPVEVLIDNFDGLYDGLPVIDEQTMRRTNRMRLSKKQRLDL